MSDEEKDLVEETTDETDATPVEAAVEAQAKEEAEIEGEAQDKAGADIASTDKTGVEIEAKDEVEAEAEREVVQPTGTDLATPMETGPTSNERIWAALAHASVLLTFALGVSTGGLAVVVAALVPLAIWLVFRDRSRFVAFHALQSTVFQLAALVAWLGLVVIGLIVLIPAWLVTILLLVVLIGLLLLPVTLVLTVALAAALVALPFAVLVYGLYGAFEVYAGRPFRYWLVADWIEQRGVKS